MKDATMGDTCDQSTFIGNTFVRQAGTGADAMKQKKIDL